MRRHVLASISLAAAAAASPVLAQPSAQPTPETAPLSLPASSAVRAVSMTDGLEAPWGMAFLPNGELLVTEQFGQLRVIDRRGRLDPRPIAGVPAVAAEGQGGLMDVTLHPNFARNRLIYLSHSAGDAQGNATRVIRAELRGRSLRNVTTIFEVSQKKPRFQHFGSRFAWLPDGTLLVSIGDGGNPPTRLESGFIREQAQNLDSHLGKVIRIHDDGRVPTDNPFVSRPDARPEVWSYGHRNIQGMARDPVTGHVWATEHGSQGGDELNLVRPGANHGWPLVTHSTEYGPARTPITPDRTRPDMTDPKAVWTPAIAPGGIALYRGRIYPGWDGDLIVTGLRLGGSPTNAGALFRVDLDGERVQGQERIDLGAVRVRDVEQGPDGKLYVLTTAIQNFRERGQRNGVLVRLDPAN